MEADFARWCQCLIVEVAADALFPDGHADTTLDLIQSIITAFGDDGHIVITADPRHPIERERWCGYQQRKSNPVSLGSIGEAAHDGELYGNCQERHERQLAYC